jgi:FkbM family methyltransferase
MDELVRRLEAVEAKLDRVLLQIEFVRTHSATYLGQGLALTHLVNERPMIVNSNDLGGPMLFISGGEYEVENIEVLFSFMSDNAATFVDAGANLGFFSLMIGERLRPNGKVFAFEPHPLLAELARRNAVINGLMSVITVYPFGLSDVEAEVNFGYPKDHLGGGRIGETTQLEQYDVVRSSVRCLDDVIDADVAVDLMKIDVEGHEPQVVRGMQQIIARSPKLKILFENFGIQAGGASQIEELLRPFGFQLYGIAAGSQLCPLAFGELEKFTGYVLAARAEQVDTLDRRRFNIYPSQLIIDGTPQRRPGELLINEATPAEALFHGPYWFLRSGVWVLHIHGKIEGEIEMLIAERYGRVTLKHGMSAARMQWRFFNDQNLVQFEVVARAAPDIDKARVEIERIELVRVG